MMMMISTAAKKKKNLAAVLTAAVSFFAATGGVNGQTIEPFPFDSGYEIDVGDDQCLHYAGTWSPAGIDSFGDPPAPFVVETTAPVIINRIIDGSASRLSWGVPWGVTVIVKSDCSNNNVLQEPIEPPTVTTGTTVLNGQEVPMVSISDLPTIPTSQSRVIAGEDNFLNSSEFSLNYECWGQIGPCTPIATASPTTPVVPPPTAICPVPAPIPAGSNTTGGSGTTNPPVTTPTDEPTPDDAAATTSSPSPTTPDDTPTTNTASPTTGNPTTAEPSSSSSSSLTNKPTTNMILGLISTIALLILSTGFSINGGGRMTRMIMVVAATCLIIVAVLPSSSFALKSSPSDHIIDEQQQQQQRNLQEPQCTINVEIVYWGCQNEVYVKNSSGVTLRDNTGDLNNDNWDTCQCQANHAFVDVVNDDNNTNPFNFIGEVDDGTGNNYYHIPGGEELSTSCLIAIGRPYRDGTGNIVSASSCVTDTYTTTTGQQEEGKEERRIWSAPSSPLEAVTEGKQKEEKQKRHYLTTANNKSNQKQWLKELGQDWTDRALGEHASIASFAAFTIELMSNGAPPNLIDASLIAAQDELRHAKISFEIASELLATSKSSSSSDNDNNSVVLVEPTVLPPSKLQFDNNLTQLALGTAQEGCIDETFSAIEMAINYDKYYARKDGVDDDDDEHTMMMTRIMEITRTIALEEGNHSALAWRTIGWVCNNNNGNDDACQNTQNQILNPSKLQEAGQKRFPMSTEAQQVWNCIWTSLLPVVFGGADAAASALCLDDMMIDGGADDDSNINDKNNAKKLSMLLADKIISQVKAAGTTYSKSML